MCRIRIRRNAFINPFLSFGLTVCQRDRISREKKNLPDMREMVQPQLLEYSMCAADTLEAI